MNGWKSLNASHDRTKTESSSTSVRSPWIEAEYMQKLEDELDNRLADEALAEDSEGVPIEILFQRYGIERE